MANEEQVTILRQGVEAWNQWRKENPNVGLDFSGVNFNNLGWVPRNLSYTSLVGAVITNMDLSRSTFRRTDFSSANLLGSNLSQMTLTVNMRFINTNLSHGEFRSTVLEGSDFSNANLNSTALEGTYFQNANLSRADLSESDLRRAVLKNTNISGANLNRAILGATVFANVDLRDVKGLETVRHLGPSSIGIDTTYKSKGQIPEIFLRGCGVPDIFIEYMHALTAKPLEFYSCFISYSHADAAFAQRLHDTLQGKGVRCWLDEKDARLGVPITHNIESGIRLTDKFLLCCSKESLGSGWVNFEIDLALHRETELRKETAGDQWRLIPLDLDGHLFSPEYSGGALRIRNRLAGDFTGWKTDSDKFDREIAKVIQAIRIEGGR